MSDRSIFAFREKVRETMISASLAPEGGRVLLAVSGGPDSVTLLDALWRLRGDLGIELRVCHINHGLRGDESHEDERFVLTLAERYELTADTIRFTPHEIQRIREGNLEELARDLRYQKLVETAIEHGCARIATGHTLSDQAETVLQRLLRSTGITGLSGILPIRRDLEIPIIRPLLNCSRSEILHYAGESGLSYREDSMNRDPRYTRARIRHDLLPRLRKEFNPNVEEALASLAGLAREEEEFWRSRMDTLLKRVGRASVESPAGRLRYLSLTQAEQRRFLRARCHSLGIETASVHIDDARALLAGDRPQGEIHLPDGFRLFRRYDRFYIAKEESVSSFAIEYPLQIPGVTRLPELGFEIHADLHAANLFSLKPRDRFQAEFDADKLMQPVLVRTRGKGDTMRPLGMTGRKKIKKIMQEHRLTKEKRDRTPLICFGDEIAWALGCCVSETFRRDPDSKTVLRLSARKIEP